MGFWKEVPRQKVYFTMETIEKNPGKKIFGPFFISLSLLQKNNRKNQTDISLLFRILRPSEARRIFFLYFLEKEKGRN